MVGYSTLLGDRTGGYAIAVDHAGSAYIAGYTASDSFPTTSGAYQPRFHGAPSGGGNGDAFVAKFSPDGGRLIYATYLGGTDADEIHGIAVDAAGAAYITGFTLSSDLPVTPGAFQTIDPAHAGADYSGFIAKLSPDGRRLLYSTYLGGRDGDSRPASIAVDRSGAAYVTGSTTSRDFPTTPGAYQRRFTGTVDPTADVPVPASAAFVTKLSPDGHHLLYSTYLAGHDRASAAAGIVLDRSGRACITGFTTSRDFPTTPGAYQRALKMGRNANNNGASADAFATKVSSDGHSLLYSTYIGGRGDDMGASIALDDTGAAYIAGATYSRDYPTTPGAFQRVYRGNGTAVNNGIGSNAVVTKLSSDGRRLLYSTLIGGRGGDGATGIAVDNAGNAYIAGRTASPDYPVTKGAYQTKWKYGGASPTEGDDAFVTALVPDGRWLAYSTYIGGGDNDAYGLARGHQGALYIVGQTDSGFYPKTRGAYQTAYRVRTDAFVTKLTPLNRSTR